MQADTGLVRATKSGSDGGFVINNLPVGSYEVRASTKGFEAWIKKGLELEVEKTPSRPGVEAGIGQ